MDDVTWLDATAQAALVRDRQISPRELVDAAIARIERLNPALNAVITPLFDTARVAADSPALPAGPFRGVPTLVKDLVLQTAGDPFHAGMRFLKRRGWTASHDSHLAQKLRAAGFVIVGKTNTPELGPVPTTEPVAYGPTHNPWDPARSPGGSSGGSAAAVAAGLVPVAHGNDGGGSIRIPSSACGLVGLKPSRGRVSLGPDLGESWHGLVIEGMLARSVRDSAATLDAIAGPMPGDPYSAPPPSRPFRDEVGAAPGRLRIGFLDRTPGGQSIDPECVAAVAGAARLLADLGHTVEASAPALDDVDGARAASVLVMSWTARDLAYWSAQTGATIGPDDVEPLIWTMAEFGRTISACDYIAATTALEQWSRRIAAWWAGGFDLLLTPTLPEPPTPLGSFDATPDDPLRGMTKAGDFVQFVMPFNVTGQPAISLPLHWSAGGLPIGVQLVASAGREDLLLRVAAQLEEARPWRDRRPTLHA